MVNHGFHHKMLCYDWKCPIIIEIKNTTLSRCLSVILLTKINSTFVNFSKSHVRWLVVPSWQPISDSTWSNATTWTRTAANMLSSWKIAARGLKRHTPSVIWEFMLFDSERVQRSCSVAGCTVLTTNLGQHLVKCHHMNKDSLKYAELMKNSSKRAQTTYSKCNFESLCLLTVKECKIT